MLHSVGVVILVTFLGDGVVLDRRFLVPFLPVPELLPQDIVDGSGGPIGGADVFLLHFLEVRVTIAEVDHEVVEHVQGLRELLLLGLPISYEGAYVIAGQCLVPNGDLPSEPLGSLFYCLLNHKRY